MMKFYCKRCNIFLGYVETGKLHKKIVTLCPKCYEALGIFESLANHEKSSKSVEMPEFFKDIFKGKV